MTTRTSRSFIQDATLCLRAPVAVLSLPDGQLRGGAEGYYRADTRLISHLVLTLDGAEPEPVDAQLLATDRARFLAVHRCVTDDGVDPSISVDRVRSADGDFERITVTNHGRVRQRLRLTLALACDLADISQVRSGRDTAGLPAVALPGGAGLRWAGTGGGVAVGCGTAADAVDAAAGTLSWDVSLEPGQCWRQRLTLTAVPAPGGAAVAAPDRSAMPWSQVRVTGADPRLPRLLERSLDDLAGLLLADPQDPGDLFLAAGAPWYLTLFGRDSLWAARMLLPLGTELAAGTLRALARRQGTGHDPRSEEQPGKILHELRAASTAPTGDLVLPPLYYGSVDATLLFVVLLAEAWRWGMPHEEVAALVPHAERALHWLREHADADGDGFVEYVRGSGGGLANQGWKDSPDAVQSALGELARPPIALAEVQGYAYQAAVAGADLLDAFGYAGGDRWRAWAAELARRFRNAFWVEDERGPYVAIALDADKRPVDAVSSNPGHLLGTGLLDAAECALVADRLTGEDMDSGWGLRTMSADCRGFNPLGYHTGSVWAHDTAIAVAGLAGAGHPQAAAVLLDGLLDAAAAFDYRMPELHGGHQRVAGARPTPYPSSCRPQAWAAATAVSLLTSLTGLRPDVPAGRVVLRPLPVGPARGLQVTGLRLGTAEIRVGVDEQGRGRLLGAPAALRVEN
ncbi:glycogen debranching N-terminal domain-containing protein [Streptomyces sp. NK08204]|uniref:amylo-alpha-1,6-glucosidase n=1 Tax=Streptomyces sp. NK08204 TaxID=2873260 RepID=UPI001CEC633C|nr:glycogen debranching N-terminal domain-containing protein [Streptomyces sp. NK08204]